MAIQAALGAAKYLPASLGVKLLEKFNPKFKNYFTQAAAYGYDANNALDYLKGRFESEAGQVFRGQLEEGAARGTLRPDEAVARSQLKNADMPGKIGRTLASFGGAALAGLPGQAAHPQQEQMAEQGQEHIPGLGQVQEEHLPGLSQMQGENWPGLGQVKEEHVPGLGQMQGEHGPNQHIIDQLGLGQQVQNLHQLGNPIESIAAAVQSMLKPGQKKYAKNLPAAVADYVSRLPQRGQGGQQGQSGRKDQFLAGLGQLTQALQGLRKS